MPTVSVMTMVFGGALANGSMTDESMLDALDAMGFDGVELPSGRLLDSPDRLRAYASHLASSRLRVTCIDGSCNFVHTDPAQRAEAVDALRAAIDAAHALDCPIVLAAGSHLSEGISPREGRAMIVDGMGACMDAARAAGVILAIENFGVAPTLQCAAADCLAILDAVPGLAFVFDTGNFYFRDEDPLANFDLLADRTCHVHLKDWVKSSAPEIADVAGAPLGTGLIPNEALMRAFLDTGRMESFSLEVGAPGDKLGSTRRDLETTRAWIDAA